MRHRNLWVVVLLIMVGLLLTACAKEPATASKIEPAKVEEIEGSDFKRVVLTEKAAERIGIETDMVRTEQAMRTRRVGGKVMASPSAILPVTGEASSEAADLSKVWVQVRLSPSDLSKVDRTQLALVLPLDDEDDADDAEGLEAEWDEAPGLDDGEDSGDDSDEALYYAVDNTNQNFTPGQSVFVELSLAGAAQQSLVVPYAAVVYGLEGETWVYTNPEPLVFVRQPIVVDYIEGVQAFLTEGPPTGTKIVTVGVAELYGAETGVSK